MEGDMIYLKMFYSYFNLLQVVCLIILTAGSISDAHAADWSSTEIQFQYGKLEAPFGGDKNNTQIYTLQHASGWKLGDNFFFVDYSVTEDTNAVAAYGELYSNFSLGKITDRQISAGPVSDVGIIAGFNMDSDADVRVYLPGFRLSWKIPGFAFLNTDLTAYMVDNPGTGAPDTDNSFMLDVSWKYPFEINSAKFSIEGHMEYVGERKNAFGDVEAWILAQPQFRWDMGKHMGTADTLFLGVEYQYWMNKLGDKDTDENTIQALVVWRL